MGLGRLGIYGGTFDPLHKAHLQLARFAIEQCQLDQMFFVPCSLPPHREKAMASNRDRVEMLSMGLQSLSKAAICDYELRKEATSYTVETLEFIQECHPGVQLIFCLGGDSLASFTSWHRWQDILNIAHIAVMGRVGSDLAVLPKDLSDRLVEFESDLIEKAGQILLLDAPELPCSSTKIRERLAELASRGSQLEQDSMLNSWLEPGVLGYIVENKVYQ